MRWSIHRAWIIVVVMALLGLAGPGVVVEAGRTNDELAEPLADKAQLAELLQAGQYGTAASQTNRLRRRDTVTFSQLVAEASAEAEANPTSLDSLSLLALLFWADARDEMALPLYEALLQVDPNNVFAFLFRGSSSIFLGDSIRGTADFQQAVNLDPENAQVYSVIGSTHQQTGSPADALIALDQAVKLDPQDSRSHYYRGMALLDEANPQAAKTAFQTALDSRPGFADAWYDLARADLQLDSPAEAMRDLDQAVEVDPAFGLALVFRGAMKEWSGERAAAATDYLSYIQAIHPQYVDEGPITTGNPASILVGADTVHSFRLAGASGQHVTIVAEPQQADLDPVIVLLSTDGVTPLEGSDRPNPNERTAQIEDYTLPAEGDYTILIAFSDFVQTGQVVVTVTAQ